MLSLTQSTRRARLTAWLGLFVMCVQLWASGLSDRHQIEAQPLRNLGEFKIHVRLTVDMTPEVKVIVHRKGEEPVLPEVPAVEPKAE